MPSSNEYLLYVLDLLRELKGISYKKMMGEYILYKDNVIFGGIYDDRFLIKKTKTSTAYDFKEHIPYPGAKPMLLVDIEDPDEIRDLVIRVVKEL